MLPCHLVNNCIKALFLHLCGKFSTCYMEKGGPDNSLLLLTHTRTPKVQGWWNIFWIEGLGGGVTSERQRYQLEGGVKIFLKLFLYAFLLEIHEGEAKAHQPSIHVSHDICKNGQGSTLKSCGMKCCNFQFAVLSVSSCCEVCEPHKWHTNFKLRLKSAGGDLWTDYNLCCLREGRRKFSLMVTQRVLPHKLNNKHLQA